MNREELKKKKAELEAKYLLALKKKEKYRQDNLIEYFNRPKSEGGMPANPKQALILDAWEDPRYKVFTYTGANRTGKSTLLAILAISTIMGRWPWNNEPIFFKHRYPRKIRIVGQDWEKHISTVVIPELWKWWPKNRPVKVKKNNMGVEALWKDELTAGTIEVMSNRQESDLFEGWSGDGAFFDEPPRRKVRVACARGLIDREGKEFFGMTLLKEAWVDREVIKAMTEDGRPDPTVFNVHAKIWDNVGYGITEEGVKQYEKTLTDEEKQARLLGIPSYMSGLVCPRFKRKWKPEGHLCKRFEIPTDWMVDIGFDIHPRKEQAVLFVATDPHGFRYVFYEIWQHGSGEQIADAVLRVIQRNALRVNRCVCDPLAKGDSNNPNTTYDKIATRLATHGYGLEVASKDKQSGIIEINNHLSGPNDEPSIWFFDDLRRTIMEIEGWRYDEDTQVPRKDEPDDMMENLYRILLLDTRWYPPEEDDDWGDDEYAPEVDKVTGY